MVGIVSKIGLYSDDFFYKTFLNNGFSDFIAKNIDHYKLVNGRVIVHVFDELILNTNVFVYFCFLLVCLFSIFYFSARIIFEKEYNKNRILSFISLSISMFLFISINVLKETAFWITGFSNYILPFAIVIIAFYNIKKVMHSNKLNIWNLFVVFLAGASTEQGFMMIFAITISYYIYEMFANKNTYSKKEKRTYLLNGFLLLFIETIGFLTIFLSPASRARTESTHTILNTSIQELFTLTFPEFSSRLIGKEGCFLIVSILMILFAILSLRKKELNKSLLIGLIIGPIIIVYDLLFETNQVVIIVLSIITMLYILLSIISFSLKKEFNNYAVLLIGASFVQSGMFALGEYSYRSFLMLSLVCIILSVSAICEIVEDIKFKYFNIAIAAFIVVIEIIIAIPIYNGYSYNKSLLNKMVKSISEYDKTKHIEIDINIDKKYAHNFGYENGSFLNYFYNEYGITDEMIPYVYYIKDDDHKIFVDNKLVNYPLYINESGVEYVPARQVIEGLGGTCEWRHEGTTYTFNEYKVVVDNITDQILECTNEDYYALTIHDSFETYLGRRYIKLNDLKYLTNTNELEIKVGK